MEIALRFGLLGPAFKKLSKASHFKELPSFVRNFDSDKEVRGIPMQYSLSPIVLDMVNLQALLSTPTKVSLLLADMLNLS